MLIYVLAAAAGLALGLLTTRKTTPLLLLRVRGLYLLIPTILFALLPLWLDRTTPARIWTDDRRLLLTLITLQQAFLILFLILNLLPRHLPLPQRLRSYLRRHLAKTTAVFQEILKHTHLRPVIRRVIPPLRPATYWWHRLPLLVLLAAACLQTAVLVKNDGYMPLTPDYLKGITNPAMVAGIENGALLLKRIVDSRTELPQLAQAIRLPLVERFFPNAFPYYGLAELLGAAGIFLFLFSQFIDKIPRSRRRIHIRKPMATTNSGSKIDQPANHTYDS